MAADRRAFLARLFASGAAATAIACASDDEQLIVVPQPEPVKLYSSVPPIQSFETRNNWMTGDPRLSHRDVNAISNDIRMLGDAINQLNAAVFGGKAEQSGSNAGWHEARSRQ